MKEYLMKAKVNPKIQNVNYEGIFLFALFKGCRGHILGSTALLALNDIPITPFHCEYMSSCGSGTRFQPFTFDHLYYHTHKKTGTKTHNLTNNPRYDRAAEQKIKQLIKCYLIESQAGKTQSP